MSESEYEPTHSAVWYELQARLQTVWNERAALYNPAFKDVFAVADDATRSAINKVDLDGNAPLPVELDVATVSKALKQAGKTSDTAFCEAFWRYCNLTLKGKRLQREMADLNAREWAASWNVEPQRAGAWEFAPLKIIVPEPGLFGGVRYKLHTKERGGLYNWLMPLEDESEDDFTECGQYEWEASFLPYLDELKAAGILARTGDDALISGELKTRFLQWLKSLATDIKEHADRPAATKNRIARVGQGLGSININGVILQILVLQGLRRWIESAYLNEGGEGFEELQSLYRWLGEAFKWQLFNFWSIGSVWSADELKRLQPLGDYLCSTSEGTAVQQAMKHFQAGGDAATSAPSTALPPELNNDEAKEILARARALELVSVVDGKLQWRESQRLLAYFCKAMSDKLQLGTGGRTAWQPFEELFDVEAGTLRGSYRDVQRDNKDGKPRGCEQVDACME